MSWTKKLPTAPGWYWYRGDYSASSAKLQPVVTYVGMERGGPELYRAPYAWQPFMDFSDDLTAENFPGEWAGPIEPPI